MHLFRLRPVLPSLLFILLFLTGLGSAPAQDKAKRPPNLVVIMADDMGYETVGAYGGTSYQTPNLDRMANEGVRFVHAYSQPLCTPSRVQLMTGQYNVRNYTVFGELMKDSTTFGNLLRKQGYATFIGGKWQLSERSKDPLQDPIDFGFGEYFLWQTSKKFNRYNAPVFEANIPSENWSKERIKYDPKAENFGPDLIVNQINAFIARNKDKPFLVYYPMMLPHDPYVKTPDSKNYDPAETEDYPKHNLKNTADMMAYTDKMVGRVLGALEQNGVAGNTLVIFLGDNGTLRKVESKVGGQTVVGAKGAMTDGGTRVPFIVRWTGKVKGGRVTDQLVDTTDVLPTLLKAAGGTTPPGGDGHSLLPLLLHDKPTGRDWVYCFYKNRRDQEEKAREFARDEQYKLYRTGKFYDVAADPLEQTPLPVDGLTGPAKEAHTELQGVLASFDEAKAARQNLPLGKGGGGKKKEKKDKKKNKPDGDAE